MGVNINNPHFILGPVNNNRTAWKPVRLPVILVIPHRRESTGLPLSDSSVWGVEVFIENTPRSALVTGHQYGGIRFPDESLYSRSLNALELADRWIIPENYTIESGKIKYTTSTGIKTDIPYYEHADYIDLSDISIDIELLPYGVYNVIYKVEYYNRVVSRDLTQFMCIDQSNIQASNFKFTINHPGDVLHEFYTKTPPPYLTDASKAKDTTIEFYRPFTDALQNIHDEQELLERINWVFDAPPQVIPYLSYILGWDIPYFPKSLDNLRKAVLRRTVEFQLLAGSRKAIINLFRLFGFEILISNLWWSSDGKRFIRPNESLPPDYKDQEITIKDVCQIDPMLAGYVPDKFTNLTIPLIYRPQVESDRGDFTTIQDGGDVTLEAYLVSKDSAAYNTLNNLVNYLKENQPDDCYTDSNGFLASQHIVNETSGLSVIGFQQILFSGKLGEVSKTNVVGLEPLSTYKFDRNDNTITITSGGSSDALFVFAIYKKQELVVPTVIENLQSNRFDVQILHKESDEAPDNTTLEFAIEFLYRIKAFHSLLRAIIVSIDLNEVYQVTDICMGGDVTVRYDTDIGKQQLPPAIIPDIPSDINECSALDSFSLGYKDSDRLYRKRLLKGLEEEFEAWKKLDGRDDKVGAVLVRLLKALGSTCQYNFYGQDRRKSEDSDTLQTSSEYHPSPIVHDNSKVPDIDVSDGSWKELGSSATSNKNNEDYINVKREYDDRPSTFCDTDGKTDYCYRGRVRDEILHATKALMNEYYYSRACHLSLGEGSYYTFPSYSVMKVPGAENRGYRSKTSKPIFSGNAEEGTELHYKHSVHKKYLEGDRTGMLGHLLADYNSPEPTTLHYTRTVPNPDSRYNLAIQRPSLNIQKNTLHLPGTRHLKLLGLASDFTHPTYRARPWDAPKPCGATSFCNPKTNFLNWSLVNETDDTQYLVYDDQPYFLEGNNIQPDIPSLGDHSSYPNKDDVIHTTYARDVVTSPYVVLDQSEFPPDTVMTVSEPFFESHIECAGGFLDYSDGYPASFGEFVYYGESYTYATALNLLGLPPSVAPVTLTFQVGSGLRDVDVITIRLDCGCLLTDCSSGTEPEGGTICNTSLYLEDNGSYYWDADHIEQDVVMLSEEKITAETVLLNGGIDSLLEVT